MRIRILPKTCLGRWSLALIIAMPLLFVIGMLFTNLFYKSVPAGGSIFKDIALRPALALTMLAGMASGIFAFFLGLVAIIRKKERALLVLGSTLIGALFILFILGEVFSSH